MRFITEFEKNYVARIKEEANLGHLIANRFGWKEKMHPKYGGMDIWSLEIEAFPYNKWVKFKERLLGALPDYDATSREKIKNALNDLELTTK